MPPKTIRSKTPRPDEGPEQHPYDPIEEVSKRVLDLYDVLSDLQIADEDRVQFTREAVGGVIDSLRPLHCQDPFTQEQVKWLNNLAQNVRKLQ